MRPPQDLEDVPKAPCSAPGLDCKESGTSEQRPLRRSRLLSDDARFALQLQEEELRSGRGKGSNTRKRKMAECDPCDTPISAHLEAAPVTDSIGKQDKRSTSVQGQAPRKEVKLCSGARAETSKNKSRSLGSAQSCSPALGKIEDHGSKSQPGNAVVKSQIGSRPRSGACAVEITKQASKSKDSEKAGMVSFVLLPDRSDPKPIPALKTSRMCLSEDLPVCDIKRLVVEEVLPDLCATQITIRTSSGVLVGHDHSLRYVRTFLWPRSKGDLVLKYSISKTTLF